MSFTTLRSSRLRTAAVAVITVAALAGCGASTSAVKGSTSVPAETTAAPTTSEATTTTTTEATTTSEAPTSSEAPATTIGKGDGWPEAAKQEFLKGCAGGDDSKAPICECTLRAIEPQISVGQLFDAGSSGSLPDEIEAKITKAATECAVDPTSH